MKNSLPSNKKSTIYAFLQKNWVQNILWLIAFIAIFLLIRPFMQGDVIEGTVPEIETTSITGEKISLSDLKGQPVLIHFWATWCPICKLSADGIEEVSTSYPVINIATQSGSDEELIKFALENNMNTANILNDEDGSLMELFGAKAVPASFIIGPDGKIEFIEVGFSTGFGLKLRLWILK